jgi:hypothetical protein
MTQYIYQNGGKYMYHIATQLPNGHNMYQMAVIYSKWPNNTTTFAIPRPSQIYPIWDFGLKIYHLATLVQTV